MVLKGFYSEVEVVEMMRALHSYNQAALDLTEHEARLRDVPLDSITPTDKLLGETWKRKYGEAKTYYESRVPLEIRIAVSR